MSELYRVFIKVEKQPATLIGIWEKDGIFIRDISSFDHQYEMSSTDDMCQAIIKSKRHLCCDEKLVGKFSLSVERIDGQRGTYYPRIFKPVFSNLLCNEYHVLKQINYDLYLKYEKLSSEYEIDEELQYALPVNSSHLFNSLEQLTALVEMLKNIFRTVHPSIENKDAYGFDIRNLIILACTEFEAQIKGILDANDIASDSKHYTTKDYIKIADELRLSTYQVSFRYFPDFPLICPFRSWKKEEPTKSLSWYNSYNLIKHDRESSFKEATLEVLVNSISACFIILIAQYGVRKEISEITSRFWQVQSNPFWFAGDGECNYFRPFNGSWKENKFTVF